MFPPTVPIASGIWDWRVSSKLFVKSQISFKWNGLRIFPGPVEAGPGAVLGAAATPDEVVPDRRSLKDPWGREYVYRYPGEHGDFDIYSYGADGQPGGEGKNADINSWE